MREQDRRGRVIQAGNCPHVKTDKVAQEVERMIFCGLDISEISYCLGLSVATLQSQYADELRDGAAMTLYKVARGQIKQAMRGDSNAAQFLLRARGRWITPTKQEIDANVVVEDKRRVLDEVMSLFQQAVVKGQRPAIDVGLLIEAKPGGSA